MKNWMAIALIMGLYMPPFQILYVRIINPPTTIPRLIWQLSNSLDTSKISPPIEWVRLQEVPHGFIEGVIYAEDINFYNHHGFDVIGIQHAVKQAREFRVKLRGASTITQQCARSLFLWQGRSWTRKILEAYYTMWMEILLPKDRILELYINAIEFGDGIYGLAAAARKYFCRDSNELTPDQVSRLIAVMPNPKSWDPCSLPSQVQKRQILILNHINSLRGPLKIQDDQDAPTNNTFNPTTEEDLQ